jgi:hypothetical protein
MAPPGMRRTGFCMIILLVPSKCFRKVDLMPASAFVLVKHALVLDECFVAVFFASEPVATNKWQG